MAKHFGAHVEAVIEVLRENKDKPVSEHRLAHAILDRIQMAEQKRLTIQKEREKETGEKA